MDVKRMILSDRPWLDEAQRKRARALADELLGGLTQHEVAESVSTILCVGEVVTLYLLVEWAEQALADLKGSNLDDPKKLETAAEGVAKAHERLRKARKEYDDLLTRFGKPVAVGVADKLKPVLKKAEGVLADAQAFEQKKKSQPQS